MRAVKRETLRLIETTVSGIAGKGLSADGKMIMDEDDRLTANLPLH
jgi:hypothetical protein